MNASRLYLNVTFISEIVNTQGDITLSDVLQGLNKYPIVLGISHYKDAQINLRGYYGK